MAIRRIVAADIPTLRTRWDAYKAAGVDFPGVPSLDAVRTLARINDPSNIVLIDPTTKTLAICITPGNVCEIELMFTATAGATAAVHAMDAMFEAIVRGCITRGIPSLWGANTFPAGLDVQTTRPIRYFSTLCPPGTKTVRANPDGTTYVRYDAPDLPALLAALLARTP